MKNRDKTPLDRRISFGKHAGKLYSEVPTDYLQWFVKNGYDQMADRKIWAQEELDRRKMSNIPTEKLQEEIREVSRECVSLRNSRSKLTYKFNKSAIITFSKALREKEKRHSDLIDELIKRGVIIEGKPRW